LLIDNILVVNNLRDIETDARVGKMTLAVRLGKEGSLTHYRFNMAVSFCVPLVLWLVGGKPVWIMLTWLSVPLGIRLQRDLSRKSGRALNQTLAQTGLMALLFSGLYAAGLVAARLLTG
jgi:1,4-dihydroxy-2-naphthoate octaprenyltransferase